MSWFDRGHPYRVRCTVDNTGIGALTGFPARVRIPAIQARWADGVRFHQNNILLAHELDALIEIGGQVYADYWVNLPAIPNNDTMDFFAYLGAAAPSVANLAGVWDTNYVGVYHLSEQVGAYLDSAGVQDSDPPTITARNRRGDHTGFCGLFDGTDDQIDVADNAAHDVGGAITLETYYNMTAAALPLATASVLHDISLYKHMIYFTSVNAYPTCYLRFTVGGTSSVSWGVTAIGAGWSYCAATFDRTLGANRLKIYGDGAFKAQVPAFDEDITSGDEGLTIGRFTAGFFEGFIDEVRVSNVARSADYIAATAKCLDNTYVTTHGIESRVRANRALAGPAKIGIPLTTRAAALDHILDGKTRVPPGVEEIAPFGNPGKKPPFAR